MTGLNAALERRRQRVEARLARLLPSPDDEPRLVNAAMRYALTAPGKRLRPVLTLTTAAMFGDRRMDADAVLDFACAVEMVHACSLILDDLPMMDDAALRRGRETTHLAFGESTAVLAAFGLLNRAFAIVAERGAGLRLDRYTVEDLQHHLSGAIGTAGLIGGQALDLEGRGRTVDLERLEYIHSHKTGALFICAAELGAMAADARRRDLAAVTRFAKNLGLAFQITDDLIDRDDSAVTGKDSGQDADHHTFVTLLGRDGARALASELLDFAIGSLAGLGRRADDLRVLADFVRHRRR